LFLAPFAPRRNGTHGERRAPVDTAVIGICCTGAVRERLAAWVQQLDRFYRQHGVSK